LKNGGDHDQLLNFQQQAIASLTLLTTWETAGVVRNKQALPMVIFENTKRETKLWVTAGAKNLSDIMPVE
jgi:hypothetical protein